MPYHFTPPAPEDPHDEKLLADVEQYGLHILGIFAEDNEPEYAFSVGLYYRYRHPEILLIGLNSNTAKDLINDVAALIQEGATFQPGNIYDEIIRGYPVTFIAVDFAHYREYLGYANWFYRSLPAPYPALQMVWPDKEGRFPWQSGYDESFRHVQPLLGSAPKEKSGSERNTP
ncbi:MAG: DUF4262 domain-containing protein [Fluviicoccus sp.]|uniref:DUF4262 domain-containing protein n=1 Tax=Fluviicoccus sp. TaxID=2003552 RepID=UPI002727E50F|nr:DUF4262 domain-containing protein [Fluviicoccus sp.]MDO8331358.1 DUF4262 domain-containing protein [Fluviicoccus sp.]